MHRASYYLPLNKEEVLEIAALGDEEQKWLAGVFADSRFIAALRRAQIQKPSPESGKGDTSLDDVRRLAQIRGWELCESALLTQHKLDPIESDSYIEETYDSDRELTDQEKAEQEAKPEDEQN